MRRLLVAAVLLAAVLLAAACADEAPAPPPARVPIAVEYVHGESLAVHAKPSDDAPVIAQYDNGESVSVFSRKGEWSEVRTAGGSGWARSSQLASSAELKAAESDNLKPRFKTAPAPVTEPGAHGAIHLVATVNGDGEITDVKVESNTTGSRSLEAMNLAALRRARFYPIMRHGKRTPFVYDYNVTY